MSNNEEKEQYEKEFKEKSAFAGFARSEAGEALYKYLVKDCEAGLMTVLAEYREASPARLVTLIAMLDARLSLLASLMNADDMVKAIENLIKEISTPENDPHN